MDNTAKLDRTLNQALDPTISPPAPTLSSAPRRSWAETAVTGLSRLPARAARLFEDGYRIPLDPTAPGRFLVFKPNNPSTRSTSRCDADYTVEFWRDRKTNTLRYRCTCQYYKNLDKYTPLRPQCKHGMAILLRYEKDRENIAAARRVVARYEHLQALEGAAAR